MSSEKEKDARDTVLIFLAVFIVLIYLIRGWIDYPKEKGAEPAVKSPVKTSGDIPEIRKNAPPTEQGTNNDPQPIASNPQLSGEEKQVLGLKIDINKAAMQDFESLPGIGNKLAKEIIRKRQELGGFKSIDDIRKVKGIGEKKFKKIKQLIEANPV